MLNAFNGSSFLYKECLILYPVFKYFEIQLIYT